MGCSRHLDGVIDYKGEWFNGVYHGIGIKYVEGVIRYKGSFKNG
jgi:hypothetical protein